MSTKRNIYMMQWQEGKDQRRPWHLCTTWVFPVCGGGGGREQREEAFKDKGGASPRRGQGSRPSWVCFIFRTTVKEERISKCLHKDIIVETLLIESMTLIPRDIFLPDFYDREESIQQKLQERYNLLVSLEEKINSNKSKGLLVRLGKNCHLEECDWEQRLTCRTIHCH